MEPEKEEKDINQIVKNKSETVPPTLIRKEFYSKNHKDCVFKVG